MQTRRNLVAAALLFVAAFSEASMTPHHATEADIRMLDCCLNAFGLRHGRYPSQSEGLSLLVTGLPEKPETGSYAYITAVPKDAWGRNYVYRFPSVHNPEGPDIYSLGEDGISKTCGDDADDINNWNTGRPWAAYYSRPVPLGRWLIGCAIASVFGFLFWVGRNVRRAHRFLA